MKPSFKENEPVCNPAGYTSELYYFKSINSNFKIMKLLAETLNFF